MRRSWASLATRTSAGNISFIILVIVAEKHHKNNNYELHGNYWCNRSLNRKFNIDQREDEDEDEPLGSDASSLDFPTISIGSIVYLSAESQFKKTISNMMKKNKERTNRVTDWPQIVPEAESRRRRRRRNGGSYRRVFFSLFFSHFLSLYTEVD